jgi:Protein of unknown function (DUF4019)
MKHLYLRLLVAVVVICFVASTNMQAEQTAEKAAQEAAEAWLALVDSGKYSESWNEGAQILKTAVSKEQWESTLQKVRTPLGKLDSRKLKSAQNTKKLPNAPEGEYVVIQYETSFENMKAATETIIPMVDKDGKWRVSGYFIK